MPGNHPDAQLAKLVLGNANEQAEEHLERCSRCRDRVAHLARRASEMPNVPVATILLHLEHLLAALAGSSADADAAAPLAAFLQVPLPEAHRLLRELGGQKWQPGPAEGTFVLPVRPGRAFEGSEAFLVRIDEGCTYPKHKHESNEHLLILSGGIRDDDGRQLWRLETALFPTGTEHASSAIEGHACILVARAEPVT